VNDKLLYLIVNKIVMVVIAAKSAGLRALKFVCFYKNATIRITSQPCAQGQIHLKCFFCKAELHIALASWQDVRCPGFSEQRNIVIRNSHPDNANRGVNPNEWKGDGAR